MKRSRVISNALVALALALPVVSRGMTLAEAIERAYANNPELRIASIEVGAAGARRVQAGARPNPEVSLTVENLSGDLPGLSRSETTLSIGHVLELGSKRGARVSEAAADEVSASIAVEAAKKVIAAKVAREFLAVLEVERHLELQQEAVRIAEDVLTSAQRKVLAGAVSPAEESRARLELERARLDREDLAAERSQALDRLTSLWGGVPVDTASGEATQLEGSITDTRALPSKGATIAHVGEYGLDLERLAAEEMAAQKRSALARALRWPDLTIETGYRRLAESDENTFLVGATMPLPIFDRQKGALALAATDLDLVRAEIERVRIDRVRSASELLGRAERAAARVVALKDGIAPAARQAFEDLKIGYERGRFTYIDLLEAERAWNEVRVEELEALLDHHQSVIDLELLIGGPLESIGNVEE